MKVCFWGNVSDTLKGHTPGGGELQIVLMAKLLTRAGNDVVIIDLGGKDDFVTVDGIRVITVKGWMDGIRVVRTFTHRLPQFYRLLKDQNADIYYCRIRDFRHILAYWAARKVKGKFVLSLASDLDLLSFWMRCKHQYFTKIGDAWFYINGLLIEIIYPFLLRRSDLVLTQHEGQANILKKKKINTVVIHNLIDLSTVPNLIQPIRNEFSYVGAIDKRKGFVEFYKLVDNCPHFLFKVIGKPRDKTGNRLYVKLKSSKNVILLGQLKHSDTMVQIANSKALISTSLMEGFPNIFIEAWACGIPVLSLFVNPGNILEKYNLGYCANGSMEKLIQKLGFYNSPESIGLNAKMHVENTYVLNDKKISEINAVFESLIHNNSSESTYSSIDNSKN